MFPINLSLNPIKAPYLSKPLSVGERLTSVEREALPSLLYTERQKTHYVPE